MEEQLEEQDPQDNAVLSEDMAEPAVEQQTIMALSVYDALVQIGRSHGKLYRTSGKRADLIRFDLTTHSVFAGNTFIILRGEVKMPVLETAMYRVDITGLPWLTEDERKIDPVKLFEIHYKSRPNGSEKFMLCNFPAADVDDLTDDEIVQGVPRNEARIALEAWVLCAAMDDTLRKYVESQPNWKPGNWWWSPDGDEHNDKELVIKTDWWRAADVKRFTLEKNTSGWLIRNDSIPIARISSDIVNPAEARTFQMAEELRKTLASLADATFRLQLRTKDFSCEPLLNEANRVLRFIERG